MSREWAETLDLLLWNNGTAAKIVKKHWGYPDETKGFLTPWEKGFSCKRTSKQYSCVICILMNTGHAFFMSLTSFKEDTTPDINHLRGVNWMVPMYTKYTRYTRYTKYKIQTSYRNMASEQAWDLK